MKIIASLITVIAAVLLASPAVAADPVVVVRSATLVTVDGLDAGKPADTIRNRLKELGVVLEDRADGTIWKLA